MEVLSMTKTGTPATADTGAAMTEQQHMEAARVLQTMRKAGSLPVSPLVYPLPHSEAKAACKALYWQFARAVLDLDSGPKHSPYGAAVSHALMVFTALLEQEDDRVNALAALGAWATNDGIAALVAGGWKPTAACDTWDAVQVSPLDLARLTLNMASGGPTDEALAGRVLAAAGVRWAVDCALNAPETLPSVAQRLISAANFHQPTSTSAKA